MSRDSSRTHLHLHSASHADLFEDFMRVPLLPDTIFLPPQHQPINPEDEDDVVPDQHAAFGIAKATRDSREPGWRDLGLVELANGGPAAVHASSTQSGTGAVRPAVGSSGGGQQTGEVAAGAAGLVVPEGRRPGDVVVGPANGIVGVPVSVRAGLRGMTGSGTGSDLRG